MDRGAWQATVHGVARSQTRLSTHTRFIYFITVSNSYQGTFEKQSLLPIGPRWRMASRTHGTVGSKSTPKNILANHLLK